MANPVLLVDVTRQQVRNLERFRQDLEILTRLIAHDLTKPCDAIERSCRSLLTRYRECLDPRMVSLAHEALDAVSEVQRLLGELLNNAYFKELDNRSSQEADDVGSALVNLE